MSETTRLVAKVFIQGTMEAVWREITKTGELQKAFFNMRLDTRGLEPGAKIAMRSGDGKYTGVVGEVLEWDPPRRYAHTFRFTSYDDPPCKVIYELEETEGGVEFTLITEDVVRDSKTAKQMAGGAKMIANTLKAIVETGKPPLGIRMLHVLFALTGPLTPKKCLSEHWPV